MSESAMTARLHQLIPMSQNIGVMVSRLNAGVVELTAPLAPNTNHAGTAFGGSVYSLGVLACWTLAAHRIGSDGLAATVVIAEGQVTYQRPVTSGFTARCELSDDRAWERATRSLRLHGKGLLVLDARIFCEAELAATFSGRFVLMPVPEVR